MSTENRVTVLDPCYFTLLHFLPCGIVHKNVDDPRENPLRPTEEPKEKLVLETYLTA